MIEIDSNESKHYILRCKSSKKYCYKRENKDKSTKKLCKKALSHKWSLVIFLAYKVCINFFFGLTNKP